MSRDDVLFHPKFNHLNDETTCENQPWNGNDYDLQVPSGGSVTLNARVSTEESMPVANDVCTGE